jgi:hypothetical protein
VILLVSTTQDDRGAPENVKYYLDVNSHRNKKDVAIMKVFARHLERHFNDYHDFDTESLFRWKLKFLPLLVTWFERARSVFLADASDEDEEDLDNALEVLEDMKLATVYKFVRGLPLLIIDGYNSRRTNTRMSRKRRLDGEAK